ncbi:MAG: hypothetical protein AB7Q29_05145 [Vicinamibacterales bacterium]
MTQVIRELTRLEPSSSIVIRSMAPRWFLDAALPAPAVVVPVETDVGVVQPDSLSVDPDETARRAAWFYGDFAARVDREARELRAMGTTLVVGDVPPLAFAAAARAGIPSMAIANFTWDWIYAAYARFPLLAPGVLDVIADAYAQATLALRLPFAGGFATFSGVEDIPLIARAAPLTRDDARGRLGLPGQDVPVVLASFGGHGLRLPLASALGDGSLTLLLAGHESDAAAAASDRLRMLTGEDLAARGLTYPDLVAAADVVLSKSGYGIVSECIANGTPLVYASRGHFVEHEIFVRDMPRVLRCLEIDRDDLLAGHWTAAVRALLAQPAPPDTMRLDGARIAAERLVALARQHAAVQRR